MYRLLVNYSILPIDFLVVLRKNFNGFSPEADFDPMF